MTNDITRTCPPAASGAALVEAALQKLLGISVAAATPEQFSAAVRRNFAVREENGATIVEPVRINGAAGALPVAMLPFSQQRMIEFVANNHASARRLIAGLKPRQCCKDPETYGVLVSELGRAMSGVLSLLAVVEPSTGPVDDKFDLVADLWSSVKIHTRSDANSAPADQQDLMIEEADTQFTAARARWNEWKGARNDPERNVIQLANRLDRVVVATACLISELDKRAGRCSWGRAMIGPTSKAQPAETLLDSISSSAAEQRDLVLSLKDVSKAAKAKITAKTNLFKPAPTGKVPNESPWSDAGPAIAFLIEAADAL